MGAADDSVTASGLIRFLRTETAGGVVLLLAAACALIWANSPVAHSYTSLSQAHLGPHLWHMNLTVAEWTADGLLAVFFFVAGLELKRELTLGDLSSRERAVLPVAAAVGGVVLPALICLGVGWGSDGIAKAWAVPVATDIAFALGVLSLVGSRVPSAARVFLLALAVVDDLIAIILIAVLFSHGINWLALLLALAAIAAYALSQHRRITTAWLYVPLAAITWIAVLNSGIHPTIAGVMLAMVTRVRRDSGETDSPAERLEHRLQPYSALICVPLFALFAAGVPLTSSSLAQIFSHRIALGAMLGLIIGKPVGIYLGSMIAAGVGGCRMPDELTQRNLVATALLGGIGFTVSLLIADLSLTGQDAALTKVAVLVASGGMSLLGTAALIRRSADPR